MLEMIKILESEPNKNIYEFSLKSNEIPVDLKMVTFISMIENIIGSCEIKMNIVPRVGTLNFRILKII